MLGGALLYTRWSHENIDICKVLYASLTAFHVRKGSDRLSSGGRGEVVLDMLGDLVLEGALHISLRTCKIVPFSVAVCRQ